MILSFSFALDIRMNPQTSQADPMDDAEAVLFAFWVARVQAGFAERPDSRCWTYHPDLIHECIY